MILVLTALPFEPPAAHSAVRSSDSLPELGEAVLEDPLSAPGALSAVGCRTGRNVQEVTELGHGMRVTGRCGESSDRARLVTSVEHLRFTDGEVRLELRAPAGRERVSFRLSVRVASHPARSYVAVLEPGRGRARLVKLVAGRDVTLGERDGLVGLLEADRWTGLAVRAEGSALWLLLDDRPILSAVDPEYEAGEVLLTLDRLGNLDDGDESAVVVRNLRVSALATGDQARAPRYAKPPTLTAAPTPGPGVLTDALAGAGIVDAGICGTGRNAGRFLDEGFLVSVTGRCHEGSRRAGMGWPIDGLTFRDGEVRFDVRMSQGSERAALGMQFRRPADRSGAYIAAIFPGLRRLALGTTPRGAEPRTLADGPMPPGAFSSETWTTLAIRAEGPNLWLLINEQPILSAIDWAYDAGAIYLVLGRLGDPNDAQEVAAVFRNLRVSALASGDPARAPTYEPSRRPVRPEDLVLLADSSAAAGRAGGLP